MKKVFLITITIILFTTNMNGQIVAESSFQPLSYEEILLAAQAQAAQRAYEEKKYDEYKSKAYDYWKNGDYNGFIHYSNIALSTGWYSASLYYDRGRAYEYLRDYKRAKKEYKKAKKKGSYLAISALEQCKQNEKNWKKQKRKYHK